VAVWKQAATKQGARENGLRNLRFFKIARRIRIWRKIHSNPLNIEF
jgi:hypothetical protein